MYEVEYTKTAAKEIRKLPKQVIPLIIKASENLGIDPRPLGCKKLRGSKNNLWRISVEDYRIIYLIDDTIKLVEIRRARHRKDAYR